MTLAELATFVFTPPKVKLLLKEALAAMKESEIVMESQAALVVRQHERIQQMQLDHFLDMHGLVASWLISIESPELDVRDDLVRLEQDLGHRIAALEEHVV